MSDMKYQCDKDEEGGKPIKSGIAERSIDCRDGAKGG